METLPDELKALILFDSMYCVGVAFYRSIW